MLGDLLLVFGCSSQIDYQRLYVPIDGIYYPRKSIFVQMIHEPQGEKWQRFTKRLHRKT